MDFNGSTDTSSLNAALDDLTARLRQLADACHNATIDGAVWYLAPPAAPDEYPEANTPTIDRHPVQLCPDTVAAAVEAWSIMQRPRGHHAAFVARWPGVVLVDDYVLPYAEAVNAAKAYVEALISDLCPAPKNSGMGRVARSRRLAQLFPEKGTDRRYVYRKIPLITAGAVPVHYLYVNWRKNIHSSRTVSVADVEKALDDLRGSAHWTPEDRAEFIAQKHANMMSLVRNGYRLVQRFLKPPHVVVTARGQQGAHATTLPSSVPVIVARSALADPLAASEAVIHSALDELVVPGTDHRASRSDARQYEYLGFGPYFAVASRGGQ